MTAWDMAEIELFDRSLHEVLIEFFLSEVEKLLKKGLRSHYVRQEDEQPFLRGRLSSTRNGRESIPASTPRVPNTDSVNLTSTRWPFMASVT